MKCTPIILNSNNRNFDRNFNKAHQLFGPPGTQVGRRWFYRFLDSPQEWRRKGRIVSMRCVFYFRDSRDAAFYKLQQINDCFA